MRRTLTLPSSAALLPLFQLLVGTANRDPIWGQPAVSLLLAKIDCTPRQDGSCAVTLHIATEFPRYPEGRSPYAAADWSEIEPSLELLD